MIKVIFFDLGEVIFTNDWHYECPEKFNAYSSYFGITYDRMEIGWKKSWPLYELGNISEDEFWRIFLTEAGSKTIDIQMAKILWKKYFNTKPGMFDILTELKKNYILAVLSSTGKEWLAYKKKMYDLDSYFSAYVTSCDTHLKKTNQEIYRIALKTLNIKPEETLFIDDKQKILDVAKSVGMQTLQFINPEQLSTDLRLLQLYI